MAHPRLLRLGQPQRQGRLPALARLVRRNPAHLWQHPPEAAAQRYVSAIGGIESTVAKAREFADDGDLRFAAELASHAVFAEPGHGGAKALLAEVLTRLGYGAECATWRNCFLLGAQEVQGQLVPTQVSSAGMATALSVTQLFDSLAIRVDGPRAWKDSLSIRWQLTDSSEAYRMELSNGALVHHPTARNEPADLTVSLTRAQLLGAIARGSTEGFRSRETRPCSRDCSRSPRSPPPRSPW